MHNACTCTWVRTRAQDTDRHAEAPPPGPSICAYVCTCMRMHTRAHVRVHGRTRTCMYTRTCTPAHMYAYTSTHTRMWMYACTHASTPGTTAPPQQGEELMQTPEASHISPVQRNQTHWHLTSPMLGLDCTHFLRPQYPSTPPPLFPIYRRTVHGPRQAWFYCSTLIVVQSAHHALPHSAPSQLWQSSVQLYNGPLCSCRKIRGKTAVQQSPSRRARRSPSPRCRMWLPRATRGQ